MTCLSHPDWMENSVKPFHQNVFGGVALVEQRSGKYNFSDSSRWREKEGTVREITKCSQIKL